MPSKPTVISPPPTPPSTSPTPDAPPGRQQQVGRRVLVNTGALAGSSLWRIVISFVLQVFIARQLDIPGVGIYNAALAYLNVGQVISEIGLPSLLVRNLAQTPHHRRAVFVMSLRLQLVMAFIVWAGLALFALLLEPSSRTALWLVGASLPFYAVTSSTQTVFQSAERMELIMGVEWLINALILGMSLAVLFGGGDILALVGMLVVAQAISAIICFALLHHSRLLQGPQEDPALTYRQLWQQANPFFRLSIADVLLQRLDILLLTVLGGELITGIYSLAYNLVRVLTKLVQSFWQALYPTFSRLFHHRDPKYDTLAKLSLRYGLLTLLPTAVISAAVAPELLPFIFSADYQESASVYRILVWLAPLLFLGSYASTLLMVQRHPRSSLLIAIAHLVTLVLLLPLLTFWAAAEGAAWASLIAGAMGCALGLYLARRHNVPMGLGAGTSSLLLLAVALAAALLVALSAPLIWPLRAGAGALVYLGLAWQLKLVDAADINTFRRALATQPPPAPPSPAASP